MSSWIESCSQLCVFLAAAPLSRKGKTHDDVHLERNLVTGSDLAVLHNAVPDEHQHDASGNRMRDLLKTEHHRGSSS